MFAALLLIAGGLAIGYAVLSASGVSPSTDIMATLEGWQNVNDGPTWVPVINETETSLGIPTNLLARMAYQESSFLPDVIDGTQASSAGALGILQLMPSEFSSVQVATPFSSADTQNQISQAGQYLVQLYQQFNDWGVAVAAYDAGPGTMQNVLAGTEAMPTETQTYLADVLSDVPVSTQLTA